MSRNIMQKVIGALAYGTGYGALNWTGPALKVVKVCKPCVKWDYDGRTYAIDCYLKLLVRLCHSYDSRGGMKRLKDGASQDQILNKTRLQAARTCQGSPKGFIMCPEDGVSTCKSWPTDYQRA
ncbi:PREDICTED: protein TPLATE-like [Tarenaya hassleriana]|uniref:protein TPLATE-like n=1 Tax=Tarenaya hassleriana TaxID=28532 RepID=UPI00053C3950|nr:PREDICTED: protein TPLATE-like [Tarenaya hassleriana]